MEKIFNNIKSAYENKVLRDYFVVEFDNCKVIFAQDGNWFMKVDNGGGEYAYTCMLSSGKKLHDSGLYKAAEIVNSIM